MKLGFREILFLVLLLAMPVAAYFFVFEPRNQEIEAAYAEIAKKQAKLQQLERATRSIEDLGEEIVNLQDAISVFEQKLPEAREVEVILKELANMAAQNRLRLTSLQTEKQEIKSSYSELPLRMRIVGDFDGFYSFLLDLEKLSRITQLPKMELTRVPTDDGTMQANLLLHIFYETREGQGQESEI